MKEIKIKSVGLSISATIVSGLALTGWVTSKEFKGLCAIREASAPWAIAFFSSSTTGIVAAAKSRMDERDVNEKLKRIVDTAQREQSESEGLVQKSAGIVSKLSNELQTSQKQLEQVTAELQATKSQLQMAKDAFNLKCQELAKSENTKDTRFSHFLKEYTTKMGLLLVNNINQVYGSLLGKCDALLKRPEYSNIHFNLENFKASLEQPKKVHLSTAQEIGTYDVDSVNSLIDVTQAADEITTLTIQVMEELSAHKVRYRNMINTDERRALQQYMDSEPHKITKRFAVETLREQTAYDKDILQSLEAKIDEHGQELERDRREFLGVLKQLESANERVALLSQPILWEPAIIAATKIGNIIIQFFQQQRIHMDRSHWAGDKHEATLYFHVTRINPTQRIDVKSLNEHGEYLAQLCQCLKPIVFSHDYEETHLLTAKVVMLHRPEKIRAKEKIKEEIKNPLVFLQPHEALLSFVRDSYHVGLWGSTGTGKSTAISNIIGGMILELGGAPTIRTTIPKLDIDTGKMFAHVDWLGIQNSIFGLLEAALEIQHRIHINEQCFIKGEEIQDFDPILFFIDEINAIFTRWRSITDGDLEDVLTRFETTLSGDRLIYFQNFMRLELTNYKSQFAKKLLLFTWQTGRSLKVKSLISGQNLQPGSFGMMKNDLENCAYITIGKSIKTCVQYKVDDADASEVLDQHAVVLRETQEQSSLRFTGLFCPTVEKAFFAILPPPNTYKWSKESLAVESNKPATVISLQATKVLEYFKNAKVKTPKTLRSLKKADSLTGLSEQELINSLAELVEAGLLLAIAKDKYILPIWEGAVE